MFGFMVLYLIWFDILEDAPRDRYYVIHCALDDKIPLIEPFIIPYMMWFGYIVFMVCYMYIRDKHEYHRLCTALTAGMVIFLIISTFFPNILFLRPDRLSGSIFARRIRWLYMADTSTNVFPSIHCYNSLCVMVAAFKSSGKLAKKKLFRAAVTLLSVSVILSTVFIKQHSVIDVIGALLLYAAVYTLVYRFGITFLSEEGDGRPIFTSAHSKTAR